VNRDFKLQISNLDFWVGILQGLGVIMIKIIAGFLVILQGASLQIFSLCLLRRFICQLGGVTPFSISFVLFDLLIRFCDGTSFNHHGRGKEDALDGVLAIRTKSQGRLRHPLDDLEP